MQFKYNKKNWQAYYNHIPENEKTEYREDGKRMDHLHKYYYIYEIIEEYNQHIR